MLQENKENEKLIDYENLQEDEDYQEEDDNQEETELYETYVDEEGNNRIRDPVDKDEKKEKKDKKKKKKKDKKEKDHEHKHDHDDPEYKEQKKEKKEKKKRKKEAHNEEMWNRLETVAEHTSCLNLYLITGLLIASILLTLGIIVLVKTGGSMALGLVIFAAISILSFIYGLFAVKWYKDKVQEFVDDEENNNPEKLDQCAEVGLLDLYNFLMMIILFASLFFAVECYGFQDATLNKIKSTAMDKNLWTAEYGVQTYDDVVSNAKMLLYIVGSISLSIFIFMSALLLQSLKMLGTYRSWKVINEFVSIVFFILGFGLVYYAIYSLKYQDVTKVQKNMPSYFPPILIIISLFSIVIAVLGFIGSFFENKHLIKIFSYMSAIVTGVMLILFISAAVLGTNFKGIFECSQVLDYVEEEYAKKSIGCKQKYVFVQKDTYEGMKCPKERIVTAWEVNLGKEVDEQQEAYGCLDNACCVKAFSSVKMEMDRLTLLSFVLLTLAALMTTGAFYMLVQLKQKMEFGVKDKKTKWVLIFSGIAVLVTLGVFILLIPNPPKPSPLTIFQVEEAEADNSKIINTDSIIPVNVEDQDKRIIDTVAQQNTTIQEDKTGCGDNCLTLKYDYELSSLEGVFLPNEELLQKANVKINVNEAQGNGWRVAFTGNSTNFNEFTDYFKFVINCPLLPGSINVKVTATAVDTKNNTQTAFIQKNRLKKSKRTHLVQLKMKSHQTDPTIQPTTTNVQVDAEVIDVSKMKNGDMINVLEKTLNHSFVTEQYQTVTGRILKQKELNKKEAANNATVTMTPEKYEKCPSYTYYTNANGEFTFDKLYVLANNAIYNYKMEIKYPGYTNVEKIVPIGGLSWVPIINFGDIEIWSPLLLNNVDINSSLLNSINNKPLAGANVYLFEGYRNFPNYKTAGQDVTTESEKTISSVFLQMNQDDDTSSINSYIAETLSNKEGNFQFLSVKSGQYSLVIEKDGFYRQVYHFDAKGKLSLPIINAKLTPEVDPGEIRIVLDWQNGPKDVDLHSFFKVSRFLKCSVYFGKRECPGVVLDVDSFKGGKTGGEVITIRKLGQYIYNFAVNKYQDVSQNTAEGDNAISGVFDETTNDNITPGLAIPDTPLHISKAKIYIYIYGFKTHIMKLYVPNTVDPTTTDEKDLSKPNKFNWWMGLCLDGKVGLNSLVPINKLMSEKPSFNYCEDYYKTNPIK